MFEIGTSVTVLVLLLEDEDIRSWSKCDSSFVVAKHPRNAIFSTKDKKIFDSDGRMC